MKTKPRKLDILAAFFVALAPALPLQIMLLYGHTPLEIQAIAAKLTPLNWAIFFCAPLTGWLVWRASTWTLAAVPALALLVAYNNWFVGQVGLDYSPLMTTLGTLAFLGVCGILVTQDVRAVILNPTRRWWLTPVRRKAEVPVRVQIHNKSFRNGVNDEFYTTTFDISEGGVFVPFGREKRTLRELRSKDDTPSARMNPTLLKTGTQCYLAINVKDTGVIQCRAEIVRVTTSNGRYPAGMGLKFLGLSWEEKRTLANYLRTLPENLDQVPIAPGGSMAA